MKKFSFLLLGAFLLWTITFALADETNEAETPTLIATETAEATTWDTAEVTAETTATETAEATTWDTAETTETAEPVENTEESAPTISDAAKEKYGEEQIAAYEWALQNGITTINDVEKANLWGGLTRAQLAKMMSQYMTNVLWRTPAETEKVEYADVNESLGDLADFIQTAYAYKIMWINADGTPIKKFNPRGQVTRAEYATVFSRVLFWDKYNKSEWNYYENHLNALKEAEILTNTTPTIQEVRGWVMLMMYRSSQNSEAIEKVANATVAEETLPTEESATDEEKVVVEESTWATIWIANPASVYCEEQGGKLTIVEDTEGNQSGMCKLADGTEVEEWEYYRANHTEQSAIAEATWTTALLYSEEDLSAAKAVITETVNGWNVKVESFNVEYAWDETASNNLEYCKSLNAEITECAVFNSSFHIPEQDEGVQMAWGFEPNADISGWTWYLGRLVDGNWTVLTNGLG